MKAVKEKRKASHNEADERIYFNFLIRIPPSTMDIIKQQAAIEKRSIHNLIMCLIDAGLKDRAQLKTGFQNVKNDDPLVRQYQEIAS